MAPEGNVTRLLDGIGSGDQAAADELLPLVYAELRRLARARLARIGPGVTLQPTALVHEAYVRLVEGQDVTWANRAHFFAAAAEAMRRILIERARRLAREKHGGNQLRVSLSHVRQGYEPRPEELIALDHALERLQEIDPEMGRVVMLRYFAGLTQEETALATGVSRRTVNRLLTAARAWLARALTEPAAD
jgi:RNA polymerase sigma factor (TIGR02999 family)